MATLPAGLHFSRHKRPQRGSSGGAGGSILANPSEDLTPWRPSVGDPWDAKKARHLFRRAGFGGTPKEIETLVRAGVDRSVDAFLIVPNQTIPEQGVFSLGSGEIINMSAYSGQVAAWLWLMTNSPWQLQEKMALFWHDHFATGINKVRYPELMGQQINIFRQLALGKFRDLLIAVSANPAMLYWLDNRLSRADGGRIPNENYAREIMELYSMGVGGGYTEQDIKEASYCLTGWTSILGRFIFNRAYHDPGVKLVLGKWIANGNVGLNGFRDGIDVVDAILAHPAAAKFMVTKIWEYFVYEKPSQVLVDKLAARFRKDAYDVRALMETIFRSRAFYSAQAMRKLVKNPMEFMVGALRNLGASNISYLRGYARHLGLGLLLLDYAGPDGLPDGVAWINSQNVINRANYARDVVQRSRGFLQFVPAVSGRYLPPIDVLAEVRRKALATPAQIVDYFLAILADSDVPAQVRTNLIGYMTKTDTGTRTWNLALHGNDKVSGLIHLIMALPEYQVN